MRTTPTHIYFYSNADFLSNFYPSQFTLKHIKYLCVEQYLMAQKANLFNDNKSFEKIMIATKPAEMKKLGRRVKGFDDSIWLKHRNQILFDGLVAKFIQNSSLLKLLIDTKNKILVEASPTDKIYGVGLNMKNDLILDEKNWKGQNLLGEILMRVRTDIC